jgi:lipoate-protein ligase A
MSRWFYIESRLEDPAWNMAFDEALLEFASDLSSPLLRFYGWNEPAATFGYFQKYEQIERWTPLRPLIRRPTGGGLVPHNQDWTYTLVFPPGHVWHATRAEESYRGVHQWIHHAFGRLQIKTELAPAAKKEIEGQCFVGAEKCDLLFEGRKIAGAAQRRNRRGLLIQGSIQRLPPGTERAEWEQAMLASGKELHNTDWFAFAPSENLRARAKTLQREKYGTDEYNRRK